MAANHISPLTTAIGELVTAVLFFGMRSCEYCSTTGLRKTKLLQLEDIHFFSGANEINKLTELHNTIPDKVSVTFVHQKNNMKDAVITMHRTNDLLCPVETWQKIVLRILTYPNTSLKSSVNTVRRQNRNYHIKDKTILQHIRTTVDTLGGKDTLGVSSDEVGTHSVRSSFAMFLYLNNTRSDKIMMQDRWKSQAFLKYIRTQVSAFSAGLSQTMLQNTDFFTIPTSTLPNEDHLMFNPEVDYLNDELYPVDL